MEDFYEIARQVHGERVTKRYIDYVKKSTNGDYIYSDFGLWCLAYSKDRKNAKDFAEYLRVKEITLTPHQRRHIAKTYFGFKFNYDYENNKWVVDRI